MACSSRFIKGILRTQLLAPSVFAPQNLKILDNGGELISVCPNWKLQWRNLITADEISTTRATLRVCLYRVGTTREEGQGSEQVMRQTRAQSIQSNWR
jgi:hypothetical protein